MQLNYRQAKIKIYIELVLVWPFVFLGKIAGYLFPLKSKHKHFLFFPNGDIGGSIKVNADIAKLIAKDKPLVIFSKKPKNNKFIHLFEIEGVRIIDLHKWIDKKWLHFINFFFRGVLATWINKSNQSVIFGGESIFFYKIVPHVKSSTKIVELCHTTTWFNYTLSFVDNIDLRIFSTQQVKRIVEQQYIKNNLPPKYFDKLLFIDNKIYVPSSFRPTQNTVLNVLYVGRGAPQKRVHLIGNIAEKMKNLNEEILFSFVGDVDTIISSDIQAISKMYGVVKDEKVLHKIYDEADVLILTSAFEGLPIVVMDMMARGKIVLSTAVDGIPDYIKNRENGLLIYSKNEDEIVAEGVNQLQWILNNKAAAADLGKHAFYFAQSHFSAAVFDKQYLEILK